MIEIDDDSSISILKLNRYFETFFIGPVCPSVGNVKCYTKILRIHNLDIDRNTETVYRDGEAVDLTSTEYAMLLTLVTHPGQIFSAERLFEVVWNEPYYYGASNSVMVHIRNLRRKIEVDPATPTLITTVWGKGYRCE